MFSCKAALAVAVVALSVSCTTVTKGAETPSTCRGFDTSGPDAAEIRRLEERGAVSNVKGWSISEARTFFAPEWIAVQPDGSQMRLDDVLSSFQDYHSLPWAQRYDLVDLDIRVYCDTAIVVGLAEAQPIGAPQVTIHFRYLNIWQKTGDKWLYAASQHTRY